MLLPVLSLIAVMVLLVFARVDYRRRWRGTYMVEPSFGRPGLRDSTTLAPWLVGSLGIAILSFLTGLFGPLGGVGGPNRHVTMLLVVSLSLSLLWVVVVVVASAFLRRRVFWLLIGAPGALCWPAIFALVLIAISECRPGCLPEVDWGGAHSASTS